MEFIRGRSIEGLDVINTLKDPVNEILTNFKNIIK